ncbi:DUF3885 domain-containing protein [Eleftheria terrae]|uniref:DUF3885 domain-containing protein n=1 Tax=Eleftheria terrae TaxID=1597781 RepID=UPI003F4D9615
MPHLRQDALPTARYFSSLLGNTGIKAPRERSLWTEPVPLDDRFDEDAEEWYVSLAFEAPTSYLHRFLWCAFSRDFGSVRPRPACDCYLFNLADGVMVWPYDDRGMDVVGPNHALLAKLYARYMAYLLRYDLDAMRATFES